MVALMNALDGMGSICNEEPAFYQSFHSWRSLEHEHEQEQQWACYWNTDPAMSSPACLPVLSDIVRSIRYHAAAAAARGAADAAATAIA